MKGRTVLAGAMGLVAAAAVGAALWLQRGGAEGMIPYPSFWNDTSGCGDRAVAAFIEEYVLPAGEPAVIFQYGTGGHHLLGKTVHNANVAAGRPKGVVVGVTAGREEYLEYIRLLGQSGALAASYAVTYTDIFAMPAAAFPSPADCVALTHLCEYYAPALSTETAVAQSAEGRSREGYAVRDEAGLLALAVGRLRPGGLLILRVGGPTGDCPLLMAQTHVASKALVPFRPTPIFQHTLAIFAKT